MNDKLMKKLKAAGVTDEELNKTVSDAVRSASPLPSIKAVLTATNKPSWIVKYPSGYENREEPEVVELNKKTVEIMIAGIDNYYQIVDQNDPTNKIYFEVNDQVIIDNREEKDRRFNNRGTPSKGCTIVFEDENKNLKVGMFFVSVTNLKALDQLAKKIKISGNNFATTLVKLTPVVTKKGVMTWVKYEMDMAGSPKDDNWIDKFIDAIQIIKEREEIYNSNKQKREEAEAPGMGEDI